MLLTNRNVNGLPWTCFTASQEHHLNQLIFQTFSFNGEESSYGKSDTYKQHVSLVLHWAFYSTFAQLVCAKPKTLLCSGSIKVAFSHVNADVFPAVTRNQVTAGNTFPFAAYTTSPFSGGRGFVSYNHGEFSGLSGDWRGMDICENGGNFGPTNSSIFYYGSSVALRLHY